MKNEPVSSGDLVSDITAPRASTTASPTTAAMESTRRSWNTKNLGARIGSDLVSASCAGALIAPIVAIIDRSIMENTSGRNTLSNSLKTSLSNLLLRPHTILLTKPTALLFLLYGATYASANTLDTLSSTAHNKPASLVTAGTPKFAASSSVNVALCIYKDQVFARMFGPPGSPPRPVTLPSYALFAARDSMTIFASFILPPLLGPRLDDHLSASLRRHVSGATAAQFLAPAAVQLLSTPLHLLGLDVYNRPPRGAGGGASWGQRWELIRRMWLPSAAARVCRIVPAFGVGGVVNTKLRRSMTVKLE
ncbi:unnamed protein product [Clonostachys rhizophaga]|uniref:Sequence orphan n=1 Tax=Clonostachys rhizophaga TaxID=160324 RepID=A0A9N9V7C1_9HYPO|nr:unnamed protein product [Clonostachys rhizophaga]